MIHNRVHVTLFFFFFETMKLCNALFPNTPRQLPRWMKDHSAKLQDSVLKYRARGSVQSELIPYGNVRVIHLYTAYPLSRKLPGTTFKDTFPSA